MRIYLIRHAESIKTKEDNILTKKGKIQANRLAKKLIKLNINKVFVSDYTRALETFEEFKKIKPNISFIKTEELREIYRVIVGGPKRDGTNPLREDKDRKRAEAIITNILKSCGDKENIAIFTHGNFIRYFISKVLNSKHINLWDTLVVNHASISLIEKRNNIFRVKSINNIEHLNAAEKEKFYNGEIIEENYYN